MLSRLLTGLLASVERTQLAAEPVGLLPQGVAGKVVDRKSHYHAAHQEVE